MPEVDPVLNPGSSGAGEPQIGAALALSGGGYRAMLFHGGSLWRMGELGFFQDRVLDLDSDSTLRIGRLKRNSSILGGSIALGPLLALTLAAAPTSYALAAPDCLTGFVERESHPEDRVCVTPDSKARAQAENAVAPLSWTPGPFGPKTCANGLVWREAFQGDFTCVPPSIRTFVSQENALGPSRRTP